MANVREMPAFFFNFICLGLPFPAHLCDSITHFLGKVYLFFKDAFEDAFDAFRKRDFETLRFFTITIDNQKRGDIIEVDITS